MGNLEVALSEKPRPGADSKLSGKEKALLVATARSSPPEGRSRWTLELLADKMVRLTEHAHAILILDRAGWHDAKELTIPANISLQLLPPR